jgi:mRNA interferase RelE/StbE
MVFINRLKGYSLDYSPRAQKDLKKIPKNIAKKIESKFDDLVAGKSNLDVTKLEDDENLYRLRYGDYRAIYYVKEQCITVVVINVEHRREVYRSL